MTQAFNLSQFANFLNTSGQLSLSGSGITGILAVANGGTGTSTPSLVGGTNITISGSFPNQTVSFSGSAGLTGYQMAVFGSSGTWTVPSGVTQAVITVIGGGAGGNSSNSLSGASGGIAVTRVTGLSGSYSVTVGGGGNYSSNGSQASGSGGASSFGSIASANGGAGGSFSTGASGTGTVSSGTALRTGNIGTPAPGNVALGKFGHWVTFGGLTSSGNTTGTAWSPSSNLTAGSGSPAGGSGGVGGAVIIEY